MAIAPPAAMTSAGTTQSRAGRGRERPAERDDEAGDEHADAERGALGDVARVPARSFS